MRVFMGANVLAQSFVRYRLISRPPADAVHRRAFLTTLAAAPTAGCAAGYQGRGRSDTVLSERPIAELGTPATICSEPITPTSIRPVVEPAFGPDWTEVDATGYRPLVDESVVVGVTVGERARAYPVSVLWHHEAVNDTFGAPLLVTYCSNCRSGLVARRQAGGESAIFAASGLLWDPPSEYAGAAESAGTVFGATSRETDVSIRVSGNVVLYDDQTKSYWSQLVGRAICGPLRGEAFEIVPSTVARWDTWRTANPATEVLLPPPASVLG